MIKISEIRNTVRKGLAAQLGVTTIVADQSGTQPKYPFTTVKMIGAGELVGQPSQYMKGTTMVQEQDVEFTMSINCYSDEIDIANDLAYKALQYFEFEGVAPLQEQNIAIIETHLLEDRSSFLTVDWEYRIGFDVRLRARSRITKDVEYIDKVELSAEIEGGL